MCVIYIIFLIFIYYLIAVTLKSGSTSAKRSTSYGTLLHERSACIFISGAVASTVPHGGE